MTSSLIELAGVALLANTLGYLWGLTVGRRRARKTVSQVPPYRNPTGFNDSLPIPARVLPTVPPPPPPPRPSQNLVFCICGGCPNCRETIARLEER